MSLFRQKHSTFCRKICKPPMTGVFDCYQYCKVFPRRFLYNQWPFAFVVSFLKLLKQTSCTCNASGYMLYGALSMLCFDTSSARYRIIIITLSKRDHPQNNVNKGTGFLISKLPNCQSGIPVLLERLLIIHGHNIRL